MEISRRAKRGEQGFDHATREFLDAFYANADERRAALRDRPEGMDPIRDAYLAALAEHLARSFGLPVPEWSEMHGQRSKPAVLCRRLEPLNAILTVESPAAFRRRLLFISKDALSRPRLIPTGREPPLQRKATLTTS